LRLVAGYEVLEPVPHVLRFREQGEHTIQELIPFQVQQPVSLQDLLPNLVRPAIDNTEGIAQLSAERISLRRTWVGNGILRNH
jgi:hypothetical protein